MSPSTAPPPPPREGGAVRRVGRYLETGIGFGGLAARMLGSRLSGQDAGLEAYAVQLGALLGGLKGPLIKGAQLLSGVPGALPPGTAAELAQLRENAPEMGRLFVERRMRAELGAQWKDKFLSFDAKAAAAASLGQVHRAVSLGGERLACKLQYPDMDAIAAADLDQLKLALGLYKSRLPAFGVDAVIVELRERLREELDYRREADNLRLFRRVHERNPAIVVPDVKPELSSARLLAMTWLDGEPVTHFARASQRDRNRIAELLFRAWWGPLCRYGLLHADPHLGNYRILHGDDRRRTTLNLFDFGCVRRYDGRFVKGVAELHRALLDDDLDRAVAAYRLWGFEDLDPDIAAILNRWARFIYGPMLEDRVVSFAADENAAAAGKQRLRDVLQNLAAERKRRKLKRIDIPREFVLLDRAAIGLGAAFLRLGASLNFHRLFLQALKGFDHEKIDARQKNLRDAATPS